MTVDEVLDDLAGRLDDLMRELTNESHIRLDEGDTRTAHRFDARAYGVGLARDIVTDVRSKAAA